jgi:hypothetical protein
MNTQASPKTTAGCLAVIVVAILVITFMTTGFINPLAVYASNSLLAKIVVSILALLVVTSFISLLATLLLNKVVEAGTGERAEDLVCPGCGLPLIQFMGSHGTPIRCPKCLKTWHDGPACYNQGMPKPKITIPVYLCPHCRLAADQDQGLFDKDDFPQFR